MSQFQFMSYKSTPADQYMLGVASVRLYGKLILRFKHVKTKDGKGDFFTSPSYGVDEDGQKKYLQAFILDSRAEDEELMDVVRQGYKAYCQQMSAPYAAAVPLANAGFVDFSQEPTQANLPF